jgi:hypothetical protein
MDQDNLKDPFHKLTDEQLHQLMRRTRFVMRGSKEEMDKYHADMILMVDAMRKIIANMENEKKDANEQA